MFANLVLIVRVILSKIYCAECIKDHLRHKDTGNVYYVMMLVQRILIVTVALFFGGLWLLFILSPLTCIKENCSRLSDKWMGYIHDQTANRKYVGTNSSIDGKIYDTSYSTLTAIIEDN